MLESPSCPLLNNSCICSLVMGCLCTTEPTLPSFIMFLQIAFSVWFAFANSESPIIDQALFAHSEETLNSFPFFCRTEA